ncbi:MAG: transcription termination factor NusA [Candidatus Levybacteria bacterium RIFCSPHIGHO2_02_FULL_37_10]|nr:MAG: transcription termination factor NusA [Candidatus Levybacteria bacterium RIFCSPHIGHO2_02_FULL_37_10]OGH41450.1 MAG: transcription termination factor NusA [Candidatus Levybacteria bacterium RIFCSPLOWO2_02_FULL_36_8b]
MPAVQRSEFLLALNQVANERGVGVEVVLETVKNAVLAAYKKDHPDVELEEYSTTLDRNTGEATILHKNKNVTPPGFGRIAAQTARQVILQKIREKEKEAIIADYKLRVGTIVNGMVLRFAGPNIIVDVGKTEALMPIPDQIQNEKYHLNQRLTVYITGIRTGLKGDEIIVSRSSNGLLEGLFKREVPEVAKGSVVIKNIAREAGARSKVAVYSNQQGIDPVGSCVGQRGVRVQAIIAEFGGLEKIDIIQWQENAKDYIAQALSPAKNVRVELDKKEEKSAHVFVPVEELSLAIGRDGQNVRLASKLAGYRIEIEEDKQVASDKKQETSEKKKEKVVLKAEEKKAKEIKTEDKKEDRKAPARNASQSDAGGEVSTEKKLSNEEIK